MLQISTRLIANAAKARGWKVEPLDERFVSTLAITPPGGRTYYFDSCQPPLTSAAAMVIADNKLSTYYIAKKLDIPVAPFAMATDNLKAAEEFVAEHKNIVVKPIDTNHGDGITVGIKTPEELREALTFARRHSKKILLQKRHMGGDCRVLVVNGKVVAAAQRVAAYVEGDGTHTVAELIAAKNDSRTHDETHASYLSKIDVEGAERFMGKEMARVPEKGQTVTVLGAANLSRGGEAHDITDDLHPSFKEAAAKIATALDMFICGVDFMAIDYTKPLTLDNAILLEINATPGLRMHQMPSFGAHRDVAKIILDEFSRKITSTNN